jgi:MOSC domain-containing protein YiiM
MEPGQSAKVVAIFTAPAAGCAMEGHDHVELAPGLGIPGDRYATRTGHWSDPRWKDQEVTLIEAEFAERFGLTLPALRRNIVTRGVELTDLCGLDFSIGSAMLRGMRRCAPCKYIERLNERPGLFLEIKDGGGLRAKVLHAGRIVVDDELRIVGIAPEDGREA